MIALSGVARGEPLISATFSNAPDPVSLVGLDGQPPVAPEQTVIEGAVFRLAGGAPYDVWKWEDRARMHNGGAVAVELGGRNVGTVLTISAAIQFEHPVEEAVNAEGERVFTPEQILEFKDSQAQGFAVLGFYSDVPGQEFGDLFHTFTGLRVGHDGSLQLYVNGQPSGDAIPFVGTYRPDSYTPLTYSVDTTTGTISKVSFGTSKASYQFVTNGFDKLGTTFVGFGGTLGNHPMNVEFRTFKLEAKSAQLGAHR